MKNSFLKRCMALIMVFIISLSITACSAKISDGDTVENTKKIQLIDQAGREITLDKPAESIVSCYYITTYSTMALGIQDRVIGLEKKADSRPIYHMAAPELLEKTQVGTLKEFNVEATAKLEPDLVLMPVKLADYADTLTNLGINVLVVNPESQEKLEEMLMLIAKACGVEEKAEKLILYYDEQLERINKVTLDTQKPSVYMAGNSSYLTTAPGAMYQSDIISIAGGNNVAQELEGKYWTEVSYETIINYNPEVIIIPCGSNYSVEDIMNDKNLANITAVKNKAVYQMPQEIEEWDSPVPSGILGVMWLTSVLHEDVYPFDELVNDVSEYYNEFYGFEIDKNLITK